MVFCAAVTWRARRARKHGFTVVGLRCDPLRLSGWPSGQWPSRLRPLVVVGITRAPRNGFGGSGHLKSTPGTVDPSPDLLVGRTVLLSPYQFVHYFVVRDLLLWYLSVPATRCNNHSRPAVTNSDHPLPWAGLAAGAPLACHLVQRMRNPPDSSVASFWLERCSRFRYQPLTRMRSTCRSLPPAALLIGSGTQGCAAARALVFAGLWLLGGGGLT